MAKMPDHILAWASLVHAGSYMAGQLNKYLQDEFDLSAHEQDVLSQIARSGGQLRMVDLSDALAVSKAGITKMIDRMEASALVRRGPSGTDRRVINVELTKKGERLLPKVHKAMALFAIDQMADLSAADIRCLNKALEKLLKGFDRWSVQLARMPEC